MKGQKKGQSSPTIRPWILIQEEHGGFRVTAPNNYPEGWIGRRAEPGSVREPSLSEPIRHADDRRLRRS